MFKAKQFKVRKPEEVLEDLAWARKQYRRVERIFLCDGDALCLANHKLLTILEYIEKNFPECERVTTYGRASDVLRKSRDFADTVWKWYIWERNPEAKRFSTW